MAFDANIANLMQRSSSSRYEIEHSEQVINLVNRCILYVDARKDPITVPLNPSLYRQQLISVAAAYQVHRQNSP
jgi:hypothetical protein